MSRYTGTCFFVRSSFAAMSTSSDSEFDAYLQELSVVDDSNISISDVDTDDLSSDDAGDGNNDAGGDQEFSETLQNVDILEFRERVGSAHSIPLTPLNQPTSWCCSRSR